MLRWLIRGRLAAFEKRFDYDMSYARDILAADTSAFFALSKLMAMSNYRKDVPTDVAYAVKITGTLAEDCGPCTQLMVTMGLKDGVAGKTIAMILGGDTATMPAELALSVKFARASLAHDPAADDLRDDILKRWGPRALVSLAFGLTMARVYPTLKYALGHGKACQRIVVEGEPILVRAAELRQLS
jgi:hypothetical protein